MDSITQAALGGLCGELLLRKQLGWKGAAWGVFFGTVPDLDVFMSPWLDEMDKLRNHRSLSHSIFLMLLLSPCFGWLLAKLHKTISFKRASLFVLFAWSTHVLIDCFNSYGTQIFEPFSNQRAALNNMSIIDPLFTIPMLLGNFLCLFFAREGKKRSTIVAVTTGWITLYTIASFSLLGLAKNNFEEQLAQSNIEVESMLVSPTLANTFLWRMVASDGDHFYTAYWSVWDSNDREVVIDKIPRSTELAAPYRGSKAFETLDWFSKGWWKVFVDPTKPNELYFVDMRFGEMKNLALDPPIKVPPFMWKLTLTDEGEILDQRVSMRAELDTKLTLENMWQRLRGGALDWMHGSWPWQAPKQSQ